MATRRSRLQIKPNVGPRASTTAVKKEVPSVPKVGPKVSSPAANISKDEPPTVDLQKEQQVNMAKSTPIPRRSRFPKAKPNVIDASKKRPRSSTDPVTASEDKPVNKKEEKIVESPQKKKPNTVSFPKQEVTIVNEEEIVCERSIDLDESGLPDIPDPPATPQPFVPPKSPVKAPSSLFNVASSPVKQPQANVNRTRTLSTSEAPVIKKPRRTKLDIPTDKPPDRSVMRMKDLIHWNPSSNPMKQKEKPKPKVTDIEKENKDITMETVTADPDKESAVDNGKEADNDDVDSLMPVPQVTIGPDGNIVIDEKSLVVKDNSADKGASQEDEIIDETENMTTYASFRQRGSFKRWTKKETTRFYKALAMIGCDFFLIQKAFPNRTRTEIKRKFKREEKINTRLVEKVLSEPIHLDESFLEPGDDDSSEDEVKVKKERKPRKDKKEKGQQTTRKRAPKKKKDSIIVMMDEEDISGEEEDNMEEPANEKVDTTWEPPNGLLSSDLKRNDSFDRINRRVVLTRKQKMDVDKPPNSTADREIYHAVPLHSLPVINRLGNSSMGNPSELSNHQTFTVNSSAPATNSANMYNNSMCETRTSNNTGIMNNSTELPAFNQTSSSQTNASPVQSSLTGEANSGPNSAVVIMSPPMGGSQLGNIPGMTDSSDQYVLVTVVPDGSEETVIHIYKLPSSPRPALASPLTAMSSPLADTPHLLVSEHQVVPAQSSPLSESVVRSQSIVIPQSSVIQQQTDMSAQSLVIPQTSVIQQQTDMSAQSVTQQSDIPPRSTDIPPQPVFTQSLAVSMPQEMSPQPVIPRLPDISTSSQVAQYTAVPYQSPAMSPQSLIPKSSALTHPIVTPDSPSTEQLAVLSKSPQILSSVVQETPVAMILPVVTPESPSAEQLAIPSSKSPQIMSPVVPETQVAMSLPVVMPRSPIAQQLHDMSAQSVTQQPAASSKSEDMSPGPGVPESTAMSLPEEIDNSPVAQQLPDMSPSVSEQPADTSIIISPLRVPIQSESE